MGKLKYKLLFIFFLFSCNSNHQEQAATPYKYSYVKKISDGDTFIIYDGTPDGLKIRLIGIDAPESRNAFRKKKAFFGIEAKKYLREILKGKRVRLEHDIDTFDQYGRVLVYVYLNDGTFLNEKIIMDGYAHVMTVPPNVRYAELFLKAEQYARENKRGLWNTK